MFTSPRIQNAHLLSYILSGCFFFLVFRQVISSASFLNVLFVRVCVDVFKQFTVFLSLFTLILSFL